MIGKDKIKLKKEKGNSVEKGKKKKERAGAEFKKYKLKSTAKLLGAILGGLVIFCGVFALIVGTNSQNRSLDELNYDVSVTRELEFSYGKYIGDTKHGSMDGNGTFEFYTGELYYGEWSYDQMEGNGVFAYTTGEYDGQFKNCKRFGHGIFTWEDGTTYEGTWKNDKMSGVGIVKTKEGVTFDGRFKNNKFVSGEITANNKTGKYEISIIDGEVGELDATLKNGDTYVGDYSIENNVISGDGVMKIKGVGEYVGEFVNGKRSGQGTFTWKDGTYYKGTWENDKMSGEGSYYFKKNEYLKGDFSANRPTGECTLYKNGETYSTSWKKGKCTSIEEE